MADVPYHDALAVAPSGAPANDYQRVNTSPDAFGASIARAKEETGNAISGLGRKITQTGEEVTAYQVKQQGMLNETAATNGETSAVSQYNTILSDYQSKQGLAAVAATDDAKAKVAAVRAQIGATMPNEAAKRAFDMLSRRHEETALNQVRGHYDTQIKSADNTSAQASLNQSVAMAGSLAVAKDDNLFNNTLQTSDFQIARILNNQGWGADGGTGMSQNPTTGEITFNDTPQGQQGKAVYEQMRDKAHGDAWDLRIHALADVNVNDAGKVFKDNTDKIPPETQARISAYLNPKMRAAEVNTSADNVISSVDSEYRNSFKGGGAANIGDAIIGQESGGNVSAPASVNGAVGIGQIKPDTFKQYAKPGEDINNPKDNEAVSRRAIDDYSKRYNGDQARVAVAYFSGPGNVAPAGSATPYLHDAKDGNGKSVSSYVSDVAGRLSQPAQAGAANANAPYVNKAEYYHSNYADILQRTDEQAQRDHPGDLAYQQSVHARVEQRMSDVMRQQDQMNTADANKVFQAAHGALSNGVAPTSIDQLTAINPSIQAAYESMLVNNPKAAEGLEKVIEANSKGPANGFGTKFYKFYQQAISGNGDTTKFAPYVNNSTGGALTTAGLQALGRVADQVKTPEGKAQLEAERRFFDAAHAQITFTNPATFMHDPKGEALFTKYMQNTMPAIQAGLKSGKTLADMFDPKSPDYVGKNISAFMRNPKAQIDDMMNAQSNLTPGEGGAATADRSKYDLNTAAGLRDAVGAGAVSRAEGEKIATERGWIRARDNGPQVPLPEGARQ